MRPALLGRRATARSRVCQRRAPRRPSRAPPVRPCAWEPDSTRRRTCRVCGPRHSNRVMPLHSGWPHDDDVGWANPTAWLLLADSECGHRRLHRSPGRGAARSLAAILLTPSNGRLRRSFRRAPPPTTASHSTRWTASLLSHPSRPRCKTARARSGGPGGSGGRAPAPLDDWTRRSATGHNRHDDDRCRCERPTNS